MHRCSTLGAMYVLEEPRRLRKTIMKKPYYEQVGAEFEYYAVSRVQNDSTRSSANMEIVVTVKGCHLKEGNLDIGAWAPEVIISGGLAYLLATYLGTPSTTISLCSAASEAIFGAEISVDRDRGAHDLFDTIKDSYQPDVCVKDITRAFWLHTESPKNGVDAGKKFSHPENPAIPERIFCEITESEGSRALDMKLLGPSSPAHQRFLYQLQHIIHQLLASLDDRTKLRDLNLLCDLDQQDLRSWHQTPPFTINSTIHHVIGEITRGDPQADAVESWDGKLTYLELDTLASRVSGILSEAGVMPGDCVALCFEKSLWTVVALLGVLKTGCSFLLLDISHPTSRLRILIDEANATTILNSEAQKHRAVELSTRALIVSAVSLSAVTEMEQREPETSPCGVAAVIFTSGTTGKPKGIQLEHRSICSSLLALAKFWGIDKQSRYFQFSSYAFDAGFGDILITLMSGGCVCIPSETDRLNDLAGAIRSFKANAVLLTPTVVRLLSPQEVPCLKTLICGGEKVTKDIVGDWADKLELIIAYGPAETTVACICKKAEICSDDAVKIGFPVNSYAWVTSLNNKDQLAPIGAVGELVAQGPGVARGYLNNDSSNADLFLDSTLWPSQWDPSPTCFDRSYRTGDLVRYTHDGELIFVGRRDRQVKLRGQRIELEDIECKLRHHFQLSGTTILLDVVDADGATNLVAFLHHPSLHDASGQANTDTLPMTDDMSSRIDRLREDIAKILPAYMWPVAWILLNNLPLSPTGKLNRRKLAQLGQHFFSEKIMGDGEDEDLLPTETVLARMWRKILQTSQGLRPDANFFQLGGDSLRCMKLVTLANQEGHRLTMEAVFKNPRLSDMSSAMQKGAVIRSQPCGDSRSPPTSPMSTTVVSALHEYGLCEAQVNEAYPCSALQAGLFSLSLASPSLYYSQFVFKFATAIDVPRFKLAWQSAICNFPILRTAIIPSSSGLIQVVLRESWQCKKLEEDLASFLKAEKETAFQPGQPLSRQYHILDPSSGDTTFVWTLHHAVFDGWSLELVMDHIRRHYSQTEPSLTGASFHALAQFCDNLDEDACASYWRSQLENAPAPSFPNLSLTGHLTSDKSCLRRLMSPVSTPRTSTTVLARAAWALLLAEYEGSDDVIFGNSLHGRNSLPPELQDVVGPTITTLPIRVKINHGATVLTFLDGLQEQFSAMIPYEQFGLPRIMAIDQSVKNASSFRTLLIVQVGQEKSSRDEGLILHETERSLHEYPLVVTLAPIESQIEIIATFDDGTISTLQVQKVLEQFEQIFHEVSRVPDETKLADLELASKEDKATVLRWNARHHKAYDVCVHELIRERARHFQDSTAVFSKEGTMDYATLDKLSDGLAGEMFRFGVKSGDIVGVLFEKSPWAVVSILAVIKAGAAYAPLSPAYPQARLESIAHDAHIQVVLCSPLQNGIFTNQPWRTIVVSDQTVSSFTPVEQLYGTIATPESLLYILSTSGTTGSPKIFGVQHRSFATGAMARAPLLRRGPNSRVLQFAPFAFDPSVEDILTTLMLGGCICMPSDEEIQGDLTAFMRTACVDFANITPSVAYTLDPEKLPDFKILLLSGEAPDQALVDKWDGRVQLMNGYGPSECSVKCAINCNLTRRDPRNIGYSAGTSLWVVKPQNHDCLTPLYAVGELVIESPHLTTGYINRPTANEEKFITSPKWLQGFREGLDTRMYKTGDLVRYKEDGSILYIGRGDMQLKLHGQRLEAEEVRQRIQDCLLDKQLQVIVDIGRFAGQDSDVLVAYLAREGEHRGGKVDIDDVLAEHLVELKEGIIGQLITALPKYMVPSVFLAITNIPVTANGKADRRALKSFMAGHRPGSRLFLTPETNIRKPISREEKLLHTLWQKLLGLDAASFGANSNFFELGGNSLAAIKLSAAARNIGQNLLAQVIFRNPVLSAMASEMTRLEDNESSGPLKFGLLGKIDRTVDQLRESLTSYNIEQDDVEDAYPLTRQQQRYMQGEIISPGGTTHRHIMQLPIDIDLVRFESALRRVVRSNVLLRTRIVMVSSCLIQVVLNEEFLCRYASDLSVLGLEDCKISWGLGQPLSRFSIVSRGGAKDQWLVWSSAHVVFDGWCRKLLLEDIDYAYHHNAMPPTRPLYNRFIKHVYELKHDAPATELLESMQNSEYHRYFTLDGAKVPGITHTLALNVDFSTILPVDISYATVMLAAWSLAAAHIEQHIQLLFNLLLGGRDAAFAGIDKLNGPTSTMVPLITTVAKDLTFHEYIWRVQKSIDQGSSVQHLVQLGDELHNMLASVPVIVVHPPDDYEEVATRHLGLVRSRVEAVQRLADAMFMNFCLRPGNAGVQLLMTIDEAFFPVDKAVRYLECLSQIFASAFVPGGLDVVIDDMILEADVMESPVVITRVAV
ncbi:nonribosomal peptide synthase SidD, partial [Aureobasidium melanogenum]